METSSPTVLGRSLRRADQCIRARLARVADEAGMSLEELQVLQELAVDPGRPMSALAHEVLLAGPSMTKLVDRMVDQGRVYRRTDAADRRRVLLYPTVRGMEKHAEVAAAIAAEERALAELVGVDTLADLSRALDALLARLA